MSMTKIILNKLPKISLNKWYAGTHWSKRKTLKDIYKIIIDQRYHKIFKDNCTYECEYKLYFKNRPLDVSNCMAMIKMIEDIIFANDSYRIVKKMTILSLKGESDRVEIKVKNNIIKGMT